MCTNCCMSTNCHHNTSYVDLYLLEMDLTIGEGLVDLSQTPEPPSTSTTSNHARPAAIASRTRNQDTDSRKYFVWSNNKVLQLVTILFDSDYYQKSLLKGHLTKEQEKGLKTSKEMLYKQIYDKIFPNSNITNSGSHVKTKLCWLESQYIAIRILSHRLALVFSFAISALIIRHQVSLVRNVSQSKHPSAGPVTLVTSGAYDPVQASQSSNGDTGDAMEEDNDPFPSCHSITGLEALAEGAPDDPIGPRVLSLSSAFPSPSTSSNHFGSPGATPCNHSASTAFGVDQEPESTGLSSPTKKTSASKKQDDNAGLMACSARTGPQSNSNIDTMLTNMPGSSSNDSASLRQQNISDDEVQHISSDDEVSDSVF
ncbi:uncharacterized protein UBRO_20316 [Ustilago bromivora]|uniref:Uncharacterized protein n=1 Tax=Ustilago bromivora TaxID=307758 RepID=A0A1K0FYA5_9BASI|nr:uncharacterized protein UBRO_20316 [Ustilago bromivora]